MSTHQLDLLENALDSLAEALAKYEDGDSEPKAYKFAVLHMAHFIELIFKYHIAQKHPLLIFKFPFSENLNKDKANTITLWDAINFINNETSDSVSKEFRTDLEWIKQLRNEIEHHKFTMDVYKVRITIGRLFRSVLEFLEKYSDVDVESKIPPHTMETFKLLSDEYEFNRQEAIREADEIEAQNPVRHDDPDQAPIRLECPDCDNFTLVLDERSETGYECTFCGNQESGEIPANCSICGVNTTLDELISTYDDELDEVELRCYYCSRQHLMDKDD